MQELSVEIVLPARVDQVWKVLVQFDAYSSWNPYLAMTGEAGPNGRVKMESTPGPSKQPKATYAKISKFIPNAELEMRNGLPFVTESVRFFQLAAVEEKTLLRHGVRLSGPLAKQWFAGEARVRQLRAYYDAFGAALTDRLQGRRLRNTSGNRHARRAREARQKS